MPIAVELLTLPKSTAQGGFKTSGILEAIDLPIRQTAGSPYV